MVEQGGPRIEEVLAEFLEEQRRRLRPSTFRRYEEVVELFEHCLDNYGYQFLEEDESALYEKLSREKGVEFCAVFGPEKIPDCVNEFLSYFMVRKVLCGKDLLRTSGTVMKRLAAWLAEKGYISQEDAALMAETAREAVRELPRGRDVQELLAEYVEAHPAPAGEDFIEDLFKVEKVEPGKLYLSGGGVSGREETFVVPVPPEVSARCRAGWQVTLGLVKTRRGWRISWVGTVYPL
ncbi:hypothetical protein EDD75_0281 [Thermodesulfitimonas autotrophica]|uniref:Uncharacterized protein n=1 Tax=Thermodesulfitimonas autotrophica TaxID=1894989 RepID=A0A3N5AX21_9THEO|nr:hypothetical protein EDD75_0281 [Thermodesulfitimonas autotrophica]